MTKMQKVFCITGPILFALCILIGGLLDHQKRNPPMIQVVEPSKIELLPNSFTYKKLADIREKECKGNVDCLRVYDRLTNPLIERMFNKVRGDYKSYPSDPPLFNGH